MCIDSHETGFVGKGSDHLQLIKFWPSRIPGKGISGGAKIFSSTLLQPARSVCVSLSAFSSIYQCFERVQFKLAVLVFKALHGEAPQCLTDDCQLVAAAGRRQLRSSDAVTCLVSQTRTCLGNRAFGVAGPRLWNALPSSLRQPHLSLGQFRRALKRIF